METKPAIQWTVRLLLVIILYSICLKMKPLFCFDSEKLLHCDSSKCKWKKHTHTHTHTLHNGEENKENAAGTLLDGILGTCLKACHRRWWLSANQMAVRKRNSICCFSFSRNYSLFRMNATSLSGVLCLRRLRKKKKRRLMASFMERLQHTLDTPHIQELSEEQWK